MRSLFGVLIAISLTTSITISKTELKNKTDIKLLEGAPSTTHAIIQLSERITGKSQAITVPIGETLKFQTLKIKVYHCYASPPEEKPESTAFINVWDYPKDSLPQRIFTGWIFASSPAVSIAQHPRYVIGIKKCYSPAEEALAENSPDDTKPLKQDLPEKQP